MLKIKSLNWFLGTNIDNWSRTSLKCIFLVFEMYIFSRMDEKDAESVLNTLCEVIVETTEKSTCTRALWCIAKQTLSTQVLQRKVCLLLSWIKSVTVLNHILNFYVTFTFFSSFFLLAFTLNFLMWNVLLFMSSNYWILSFSCRTFYTDFS